MNSAEVLSYVLGLAFFAWAGQPQVWWKRGWFGLASTHSLRWPAERPASIKEGYELDAFATRFHCLAGSGAVVVLAQGLWLTMPLWAHAAALVVGASFTVWLYHLILEDGGLRRSRNEMELMMLWAPFGALMVLDLVAILSTVIRVSQFSYLF